MDSDPNLIDPTSANNPYYSGEGQQQQQQTQSSLAGELGVGWDLQETEGLETEEEEREDMTTTGSSSAEYLNGHSPRTSSFGKPLQPQLLIGGGGQGRSHSPAAGGGGYSPDSSSFSPRLQKRPILTPLNARRKNAAGLKDSEGNHMSTLHSQ